MNEHAIQSIVEMALAIVGTVTMTAIVGNFIFKWHKHKHDTAAKQDISDELSLAIKEEFTRLHRQNADLQYRINKLEQRLDNQAPAEELAKQQRAQQLSA